MVSLSGTDGASFEGGDGPGMVEVLAVGTGGGQVTGRMLHQRIVHC